MSWYDYWFLTVTTDWRVWIDGNKWVCWGGRRFSLQYELWRTYTPVLTLYLLSLTLPRLTNMGWSFSEMQHKPVKCWQYGEMHTAAGVFYCVPINTPILFLLIICLFFLQKKAAICVFFPLVKLLVHHPYLISCKSLGTRLILEMTFFGGGEGGDYARNLLIKVKNMYLLIFFIMSVTNHTFLWTTPWKFCDCKLVI